jgi:hypothetical protein
MQIAIGFVPLRSRSERDGKTRQRAEGVMFETRNANRDPEMDVLVVDDVGAVDLSVHERENIGSASEAAGGGKVLS